MINIHNNCANTAKEYGAAGNYMLGANIAASPRLPTR
jgi:glutamate dehydrogenase (NADP+)